MTYTYKIQPGTAYDEDGNTHTVYGIDLFADGEILNSLPDIFFNKQKAKELVALCNTLDLSPLHLIDVVEDAIM